MAPERGFRGTYPRGLLGRSVLGTLLGVSGAGRRRLLFTESCSRPAGCLTCAQHESPQLRHEDPTGAASSRLILTHCVVPRPCFRPFYAIVCWTCLLHITQPERNQIAVSLSLVRLPVHIPWLPTAAGNPLRHMRSFPVTAGAPSPLFCLFHVGRGFF